MSEPEYYVRCLGPVPYDEKNYVTGDGPVMKKCPWSEVSGEKKDELLEIFTRQTNERERALWAAANRLARRTGRRQSTVYDELLKEGKAQKE